MISCALGLIFCLLYLHFFGWTGWLSFLGLDNDIKTRDERPSVQTPARRAHARPSPQRFFSGTAFRLLWSGEKENKENFVEGETLHYREVPSTSAPTSPRLQRYGKAFFLVEVGFFGLRHALAHSLPLGIRVKQKYASDTKKKGGWIFLVPLSLPFSSLSLAGVHLCSK